jgi:hypothetical protein
MTIRVNITACEGATASRPAWVHYDEKVSLGGGEREEWFPGKSPPAPLKQGETQTMWIHSGQRVVVYESEDGRR